MDSKSSGGRYYLRLFFDLMDILAVNSHIIYKKLNPKGMGLLDFKIVLAKLLVGTYNSMYLVEKYCQQVYLFISQFYNKQEESVDTAMLEVLKTKLTLNVIHVESFCAWFLEIIQETVLSMSIPTFNYRQREHSLYLVYFLSRKLIFNIGVYFGFFFVYFNL